LNHRYLFVQTTIATDLVLRLEVEPTKIRKRQHSDYRYAVKKGALNLVFQTLKIGHMMKS